MPRLIEIRKLAAVDMAWLGTRLIVAEYAFGVVLPLTLGVLTLRRTLLAAQPSPFQLVLGIWLLGIAANNVPLFLYAVSLARSGTAKAEGTPELPRARRYGLQQVMILVPLFVVALAIIQERKHP
jgi:hypothetical protein